MTASGFDTVIQILYGVHHFMKAHIHIPPLFHRRAKQIMHSEITEAGTVGIP